MNDDINGSWAEYRRLWEADRLDNKVFRAEMREKIGVLEREFAKHVSASEATSRVKLLALNVGLPALVAIGVALLTIHLG